MRTKGFDSPPLTKRAERFFHKCSVKVSNCFPMPFEMTRRGRIRRLDCRLIHNHNTVTFIIFKLGLLVALATTPSSPRTAHSDSSGGLTACLSAMAIVPELVIFYLLCFVPTKAPGVQWVICIAFFFSLEIIHILHTRGTCDSSSVGRTQPSQGWSREFEPRLSLTHLITTL